MVPSDVIYSIRENVQLKGNQNPRCSLPVYHGIRGSSQLEGFHMHQNKDITGSRVTGELYQAQMMFAVVHWNQKRSEERLGHEVPKACNPKLVSRLNDIHNREYGTRKYNLRYNFADTGELFGYEYLLHQQQHRRNQSLELDDSIDISDLPSSTRPPPQPVPVRP